VVKAIAHSYWRSMKRGVRTFAAVPENVKEDVRILARADMSDGVITAEQYGQYMGEPFDGVNPGD